MKTKIQISLKEECPIEKKLSIYWVSDTTIKINELALDYGNQLLNVNHSHINTFFDFSKSSNYQLLYFDNSRKFIGASYAIKRSNSSFIIQTQAKWVLLVPLEDALDSMTINTFRKFDFVYSLNLQEKEKWIKCLNTEYPLTRHTSIGRQITTVRRMKAEKELDLPLAWRSGSAISPKIQKRANEMNQSEWNVFYEELCNELNKKLESMNN